MSDMMSHNVYTELLVAVPGGLQSPDAITGHQLLSRVLQPQLEDPIPELNVQFLRGQRGDEVWEAGSLHLGHLVIGNPGRRKVAKC